MTARTPQEVHELFLDAFNRADVDALAALYEANAVLVTQADTAGGRDAIRAAYRRILSDGGHMELQTLTVRDSGDGLALLHAGWTLHRKGTAISGISTEVVRRQADGSWLFVLDEPRTPEYHSA
jgi:uncharacterized protein (TIGR02246 family)